MKKFGGLIVAGIVIALITIFATQNAGKLILMFGIGFVVGLFYGLYLMRKKHTDN